MENREWEIENIAHQHRLSIIICLNLAGQYSVRREPSPLRLSYIWFKLGPDFPNLTVVPNNKHAQSYFAWRA